MTDKAALDNMVEDMRAKGHVLERRLRGCKGKELKLHTMHDPNKSREENRKAAVEEIRSQAGLYCVKCQHFRRQEDFGKWSKPCVPAAKPDQVIRKQLKRKIE